MTLTAPTAPMTILVLPGPGRKRVLAPYCYRVTHRTADATAPGCLMTWSVTGGRESYQISLEQTESGARRWHCTCADAVYRGETQTEHRCKHVRGLLEWMPPSPARRAG